ncbi:MAG: hypothetical protein U1G07_14405 [Verrucomicrobiota bacterium]
MSAKSTEAFGFSSPIFATSHLGAVPSIVVYDPVTGTATERLVVVEGPSQRRAARVWEVLVDQSDGEEGAKNNTGVIW